jgi:hypothetical protein
VRGCRNEKGNATKQVEPHQPGRRLLESLQKAVDWADGKRVEVRITTVEVPIAHHPEAVEDALRNAG